MAEVPGGVRIASTGPPGASGNRQEEWGRRYAGPTNVDVNDLVYVLVTLLAFGLLAVLVGLLDRGTDRGTDRGAE